MEKFNPSYSLTEFKSSNYSITKMAKITARNLGFDMNGIKELMKLYLQ